MESRGKYRCYDHRVRNAIAQTKNPFLFAELDIPRSTALDWIRKGPKEVISHADFETDSIDLVARNQILNIELNTETEKSKLIFQTVRILGFELQYRRIPKAETKVAIIETINSAAEKIGLTCCLDLIGLSSARFHAWARRLKECRLQDIKSCPKSTPQQLSPIELGHIKHYATSEQFAHFSILALSWYAKKVGDVFASAATWSKLIRQHEYHRPGKRVYPAKPKVGIRASEPGQIWHMDMSIIKLIDGTRCYIQAIIDNFSRFVLAWQVSETYGGLKSAELVRQAIRKSAELGIDVTPDVWGDSGSENINENVDTLIKNKLITRTIAQIEVDQSNSMIEALFLRTKHRYLYLKQLTSVQVLTDHVDRYLNDSNEKTPHGSLKGATPFEAFTGIWTTNKANDLAELARAARKTRVLVNQSLSCGGCPA